MRALPPTTADVVAALTRRADGATDPQADDPLAGDGRRARTRQVGELLFAVADLAQRLGVDAEQALRDRALALRDEILAAEGVPEDERATANLVPRCPTRADTQGVMS